MEGKESKTEIVPHEETKSPKVPLTQGQFDSLRKLRRFHLYKLERRRELLTNVAVDTPSFAASPLDEPISVDYWWQNISKRTLTSLNEAHRCIGEIASDRLDLLRHPKVWPVALGDSAPWLRAWRATCHIRHTKTRGSGVLCRFTSGRYQGVYILSCMAFLKLDSMDSAHISVWFADEEGGNICNVHLEEKPILLDTAHQLVLFRVDDKNLAALERCEVVPIVTSFRMPAAGEWLAVFHWPSLAPFFQFANSFLSTHIHYIEWSRSRLGTLGQCLPSSSASGSIPTTQTFCHDANVWETSVGGVVLTMAGEIAGIQLDQPVGPSVAGICNHSTAIYPGTFFTIDPTPTVVKPTSTSSGFSTASPNHKIVCVMLRFVPLRHSPLRSIHTLLDKSSLCLKANIVIKDRAFLVPQFLSVKECQQIISESEKLDYHEAPVNLGRATYSANETMRKDIRNNDRLLHDNPQLAALLYARLNTIPAFLPVPEGFSLHSLNSRFRFYRYMPGQQFKPHHDGIVSVGEDSKIQSRYTMLMSLNDNIEGGETRFHMGKEGTVSVCPRVGQALLFWHQILHEGTQVTQGTKYVLRTDVFFSRV